MQRRNMLAIGISIALQTSCYPALAAENTDEDNKCPVNVASLSQEEQKKLPATCLIAKAEDNHWGWVAGGVAALAVGVAVGVHHHDNGGGSDHTDQGPTPPDDGGDVTPVPPDDGGNVTPPTPSGGGDDVIPPDDGGDDDVTPPDDGGDDDVIPPDDGGDDDVTPPDDGGDDDVTPPDDGGDDDVIPPDDGGDDDVTPPDDDGDDDVIPPDDDDDTPTDNTVKTFNNDVTINKGADTLHFDDIKLDNGEHLGAATLSYVEERDQWVLTTENGKTLNVSNWKVTDDNNAVIEGSQANGLYWKYDSRGYLILADEGTAVIAEDGATNTTTRGLDISGQDKTGVIISGDSTTNTLSGNSTVTDGATGMVITGDNSDNTISGQSTVDGAIGALISGNGTNTHISGGIDVTGGGTGLVIDGDNIKIDNTGISNISGKGSTGSIINGNGANVVNDGEMHVTDGGTGGKIIGDKTTVDNKGNSTVSGEGSTALMIDGDDTTITSEGTQNITDNATGVYINGDDADATMTGDITVAGGGTAMVIDGKDASVDIIGKSDISGQGSTGTIINGDKAHITNDGELNVTDGGTGANITGDDAVIDNTGDMTIDGTGSSALNITGDNALIISEGNQTITNGAFGTIISGDNARISNTGDIAVDGTGSVATLIDGNDSRLTQTGDLLVTNGATGIITYGENNTVTNTGHTTVRDQDSIGFVVAGTQNTFNNKGDLNVSLNGTGTLVSGDESQVKLDGDINVTSMQDGDGIYRGATGVSVTGNNTTTNITGSVTLNGDYATDDMIANSDTLTGINISGNDNQLDLAGELRIDVADKSVTDGQYLEVVGLNVEGDNNNVNLTGGVTLNQYAISTGDSSSITAININGDSNVTLSGHSEINISDKVGGNSTLVNVQNGGSMVLNDNSVVDIHYTMFESYDDTNKALLMAEGEGSSIDNQGTINADGLMVITQVSDGSQSENSGEINMIANNTVAGDGGRGIAMAAQDEKSVAKNIAGGNITLTSRLTPFYFGGMPPYPQFWYHNTAYAMLAYDYGTVINEAGATISLYGAGLYGVSASKGTALNEGSIYVDGFQQELDENGNITGETYWDTNHHELPSAGMVAGSSDNGYGDATAINTGTITVHNAGYGMTAMSDGTAINQGTINLTADEGITGETNQLVGMAALFGGVVINDTTGVININADYGQAFYSDGSGYIINNGAINLNGNPMDATDPHMGDTPTDKIWIQNLPGSGDTDMQTNETGFFTNGTLANYGNQTLNGDLDVNSGWLYNEAGASFTINGNLLINSGANALANYGTLDADTITTWHSLFNQEGGSITTDLLTINSDSTFFNDGEFTGSIAGTSYSQEIVNTGSMTVAEDGKSLISGSFAFYNQQGATLTNSGSAVEGGENTIINMTRTSDSIAQINSGTITATNGYSAITTANTGSNDNGAWIWNTETGVINGINPDAPLINLSRGYNFGNEGTINVQGDGAVAISGGTSSYKINLVNSGTINVGTEQGKADGTNGTGLIGIKGNGSNTTINNTADGVINVYADDSYAFGGQTKAIINNGEINLLCDSGCDIYAPGTTGTQHNADGTEDIAIPDAATAPAQGNIPTPPADPNAPQQLSNYIVGTNADGTSGTLKANNLVIGDNVKVGTGFTAGTADTTVVVDNAFIGSNIQGVENITSTSVVWNAQGSTDADGNVDVTMTKNAYVDVATDSSVSDVAQALDAGYTNNELYTSLNVGTTAELNSALKQVSGSQATTVFREARVLSNRFNMLADAAPQVNANGLAFNVVAQGDPRAELGNDTQYDMLALRQKLDLTESQNLTLEYGIARIDGSGSQKAGDNGLTGGYSQFFGLKHSMALNDDGLAWNNALRYDVHNLDSSRSVSYGDTHKVADSDARQQYLEFRSEGAKTFSVLDDALKVTPYAGVKFRHTLESGYQERSAGDFNLNMNSGSETAVDSIVGLKFDYAGKNGWSMNATLEGGPNLSYSKSQRTASLQGAAGQQFSVDDGQKGGGVNGLATVGVKYNSNDNSTALHLDAYQWKEDGISDKGFMLNVKKTFR